MESELKIEKALPRSKGKENSEEGSPVQSKPAPTKSKKGGGKKRTNRTAASTSSSGNESFQPDPRWADKLAEIKEMLAAANN